MCELEDYETRLVHDGKRNNREVKINCERCDEENWVRWQRVKSGRGRFCSLDCFNESQKEESKKNWGRKNARFHWDKDRNCWYAYWYDEASGKLASTTKARWLWEWWRNQIPDKHVVTYIDGNPKNCELDNLEVMSRSDWNKIHLIGHEVSDETRKKLSIAHTGSKEWRGFVEEKRYPGFSKRLKKYIKDRDNHECQACYCDLKGSNRARVHHIDGDKKNPDPENLVLVCVACHSLIHSKKEVTLEILEYRRKLK
ncbi:MAG: HNH endonuclease [Candidatus Hodarchaeales archaeon]